MASRPRRADRPRPYRPWPTRRLPRRGSSARTARWCCRAPGDLESALVSNGVGAADAAAAAQVARGALKPIGGDPRGADAGARGRGLPAGAARSLQPRQFGRGGDAARGRRLRRVAGGGAAAHADHRAARADGCGQLLFVGGGGGHIGQPDPRIRQGAGIRLRLPARGEARRRVRGRVRAGDQRQRRSGRRAAPALCRAEHRDQIERGLSLHAARRRAPTGSTPAAAASSAR